MDQLISAVRSHNRLARSRAPTNKHQFLGITPHHHQSAQRNGIVTILEIPPG